MSNAATLSTELDEIFARLRIACWLLPQALSNIAETVNGYPSQTPGAGPASGSSLPRLEIDPVTLKVIEPEAPVKLTSVERFASSPDPARAARQKIVRLIEATGDSSILSQITELYSLTKQWGYTPARAKVDGGEHKLCRSCLRIDQCTDRHRGDLCRWCYEFQLAEKRLPSTDLLDKHHRGIRITPAMIKADHPVRKQTKSGKRARRTAKAA